MRGEVVKVLTVLFDDYFKSWQIRFRVRCPRCRSINKHGESTTRFPANIHIKGSRGCDKCGYDYEYEWEQN